MPDIELDADAGLADRLWAARETAEAVKQPTAAAAPRSTARWPWPMISPSPPGASRRIMPKCSRNAGREGAGPRADDADRQARLRHRLRQDPADRIRRGAVLCRSGRTIALGGFQALRREASRAASRRWSRPSARRAARSRSRDTRARPASAALRAAAPLVAGRACRPTRNSRWSLTRRDADGVHEPVALVADQAMLDRAIRRAAALSRPDPPQAVVPTRRAGL